MLDEYFRYKVQEIFNRFKEKYKLNTTNEKNKVSFQSETIKFIVYFEKSFEIYIVFIFKNHRQNEIVDLSSVINYLNNKTEDDICLGGNQVSSEDDIDYVLIGLSNIMETILDKIYYNKDLLYDVYMYQKHINQDKYSQYLIEQMSLELSKEWGNRNYIGFLETYRKNKQRDKTIDTYLNEIQKKQLEYSQKMIKNQSDN